MVPPLVVVIVRPILGVHQVVEEIVVHQVQMEGEAFLEEIVLVEDPLVHLHLVVVEEEIKAFLYTMREYTSMKKGQYYE